MPKLKTMHQGKRKNTSKPEVTKDVGRTNVFIGQEEGGLVADWLNNAKRPPNDAVEQLVGLEVRFQSGDVEAGRDTTDHINKMVHKWNLGMKPVAEFSTLDGRGIVQRPTTDPRKVPAAQSLAYVKAVELMQAGLLTRVRRCKREGCGIWFFAPFQHALYHTEECRTKSVTSTPEFREHRKKYMRERRKKQMKGGK